MAKKAKLSDFTTQKRNINKHRVRGMGQLSNIVSKEGWQSAITVAANHETFSGSARLETAQELFGDESEPIVVHTVGDRAVIIVRDDIPTADDPRAIRLGIADNRISELNYDPDIELLSAIADEVDISDMYFDDELAAIVEMDEIPENSEWDNALGGLPSGDKEPFQQMTFTLHDEQVEQVKAAMEVSKKMGDFDSPNQNSNGNALARICEIFLTQNG